MKIAIAIPCYNCELQIERVLRELDPILGEQKLIKEVFIIENNSTDKTLSRALEVVTHLKNKELFYIYKNIENIGLGGTHKIAFTLAKQKDFTHLLILHGDHQASIYDVPVLIENIIQKNGITTLGSRFLSLKNLSGYSQTRKMGNIILNLIYSIVTREKISDLGSGLNIFRISDFPSEIYQNFDNEFTFNMDILLYIIRKNIEFQYVPIKWSTVDQVSNAKSLKVGFKTLKKLFDWVFSIQIKNKEHFKTKLISAPSR